MAQMSHIIEGLNLFFKYEGDGPVSAEHDKFCAGFTRPEDMSVEDAKKLDELGWFWEEDVQSWARFT